jgi:iron complex transport system ATP-binding protein
MKLDVQGVSWSPDKIKNVLDSVRFHAKPGAFVGIIGPNGSGKSSLLRCIYRALKPDSGTILLNGRDILEMSVLEASSKMAVVLQEASTEFDFTVLEIVLMGCYPHKGSMTKFTSEDLKRAQEALEQLGILELQNRPFTTLSGGEKQRSLIARGLAQKTRFLILDEPTSHLDIKHALEVLKLIKRYKITTIAILHDLNLAAMFCDTLCVMVQGRIRECGSPEKILTQQLILDVFGVGAVVTTHPFTGKPTLAFFPVNRARSGKRTPCA